MNISLKSECDNARKKKRNPNRTPTKTSCSEFQKELLNKQCLQQRTAHEPRSNFFSPFFFGSYFMRVQIWSFVRWSVLMLSADFRRTNNLMSFAWERWWHKKKLPHPFVGYITVSKVEEYIAKSHVERQ